MKEDRSQSTEEMLDSTFNEFEQDLSIQEEQTVQEASPTNTSKDSNKKQNILIFGGVAFAAILFIGYKFLMAPPVSEEQNQIQAAVVNEVRQDEELLKIKKEEVPNNVQINNIEETGKDSDSIKKENIPSSVANEQLLGEIKTQNVETSLGNKDIKKPDEIPQNTEILNKEVAPVNIENKKTELESLLDKQTKELKEMINGFGDKITKVEQDIAVQLEFNKKVEERLSNLENGKAVIKKSTSPKIVKKQKKSVSIAKNDKKESGAKIFEEDLVITDKLNDNNIVINKSKVVPEFEIHSIYSNRAWIKNEDGSLTTYSVGDKLSNGEIIKSIDDSKFEIKTNKKTYR